MAASKFTPEARGAILERVAAGVSLADASRAANLREKTVKQWITRGRRETSGEYSEFVDAVEQARSEAKGRPGPLTPEEFELRLSQAVRAGSVQAMKLWADLHRRTPDECDEPTAADEFDQIKETRRGRA